MESVCGLSAIRAGIGMIVLSSFIGYFSYTRQAAVTHSFDPIAIVSGAGALHRHDSSLRLGAQFSSDYSGMVRRS
jgi:hypothetical protein